MRTETDAPRVPERLPYFVHAAPRARPDRTTVPKTLMCRVFVFRTLPDVSSDTPTLSATSRSSLQAGPAPAGRFGRAACRSGTRRFRRRGPAEMACTESADSAPHGPGVGPIAGLRAVEHRPQPAPGWAGGEGHALRGDLARAEAAQLKNLPPVLQGRAEHRSPVEAQIVAKRRRRPPVAVRALRRGEERLDRRAGPIFRHARG